jgi:hypothetical protein
LAESQRLKTFVLQALPLVHALIVTGICAWSHQIFFYVLEGEVETMLLEDLWLHKATIGHQSSRLILFMQSQSKRSVLFYNERITSSKITNQQLQVLQC